MSERNGSLPGGFEPLPDDAVEVISGDAPPRPMHPERTAEFHEAANIFPLDEENIDSLAEDIRENGQTVPIELLGGKVIDGRRRTLACRKAGVQPKYKTVVVANPVAYVVSLNLHRRHLTAAQRGMIAAEAREMFDRAAKERQRAAGGDRKSGSVVEQITPPISAGKARDQVGKLFKVSGPTVDRATKVLRRAAPEVVQAVKDGTMSLSKAAAAVTEPRKPAEPQPEEERKERGKGIILAHEAINCLTRIPKDDALRKRGFQVVTDWIRHNQ